MNVETFARACSLLSKMPSAVPWTESTAELYAAGLQSLPDHVMSDVVHRAITTHTARPTVAELISLAAEVMNGPSPTPSEAWEEVERLLTTRGRFCCQDPEFPNIYREGEPAFSHGLIAQTVRRMGGWGALCTSERPLEELGARFRARYQEIRDRSSISLRESLLRPAEADPYALPAPDLPVRSLLRVANGGR